VRSEAAKPFRFKDQMQTAVDHDRGGQVSNARAIREKYS
jgi:hypothetical protein